MLIRLYVYALISLYDSLSQFSILNSQFPNSLLGAMGHGFHQPPWGARGTRHAQSLYRLVSELLAHRCHLVGPVNQICPRLHTLAQLVQIMPVRTALSADEQHSIHTSCKRLQPCGPVGNTAAYRVVCHEEIVPLACRLCSCGISFTLRALSGMLPLGNRPLHVLYQSGIFLAALSRL